MPVIQYFPFSVCFLLRLKVWDSESLFTGQSYFRLTFFSSSRSERASSFFVEV
jgi:hypothetical protein